MEDRHEHYQYRDSCPCRCCLLYTSEGEVVSSEEGEMRWVQKTDLPRCNLVADFDALLQVINEDGLNEFQYVPDGEEWKVVLR